MSYHGLRRRRRRAHDPRREQRLGPRRERVGVDDREVRGEARCRGAGARRAVADGRRGIRVAWVSACSRGSANCGCRGANDPSSADLRVAAMYMLGSASLGRGRARRSRTRQRARLDGARATRRRGRRGRRRASRPGVEDRGVGVHGRGIDAVTPRPRHPLGGAGRGVLEVLDAVPAGPGSVELRGMLQRVEGDVAGQVADRVQRHLQSRGVGGGDGRASCRRAARWARRSSRRNTDAASRRCRRR